jgi:hypothetical protein
VGLRIDGDNVLVQPLTSLVIQAGWYGLEPCQMPSTLTHSLAGTLENLTFTDHSVAIARPGQNGVDSIHQPAPGCKDDYG